MIEHLPSLNALLNGTSAGLLLAGHRYIRRGNRAAHRRCMLGTFAASTLFLVSYVTYHYIHGTTRFQGIGWIRPVYFTLLTTHTICAAAIVPLAIITLLRGLRSDFARHARIARWTYPLWLYVSITGVAVYLMLYHFYAS